MEVNYKSKQCVNVDNVDLAASLCEQVSPVYDGYSANVKPVINQENYLNNQNPWFDYECLVL